MVFIISFDGLHRSGKGSQIFNLKRYLTYSGYEVTILNGDGSKSNNTNFWNVFDNLRHTLTKSNNQKLWDIAHKNLTKENNLIYDNLIQIESKTINKQIIILDRTYISRIFHLFQKHKQVNFEKIYLETTIKPDLYFFLNF